MPENDIATQTSMRVPVRLYLEQQEKLVQTGMEQLSEPSAHAGIYGEGKDTCLSRGCACLAGLFEWRLDLNNPPTAVGGIRLSTAPRAA